MTSSFFQCKFVHNYNDGNILIIKNFRQKLKEKNLTFGKFESI